MGIPIIAGEGFVGQRLIVDDYFVAGADLNAGDVVGIWQEVASPHLPRVFPIHGNSNWKRVVGIVHTPPSKEVGDLVASSGDLAPIVVQGIAKALASGAVGVGDSVSPSGQIHSTEIPGGDPLSGPLPFVNAASSVRATANAGFEPVIGRCLTPAPLPSSPQVVEVLVDLAGSFPQSTPGLTGTSLGTVRHGDTIEREDRFDPDQLRNGAYARVYPLALDYPTEILAQVTPGTPSGELPALIVIEGHDIDGRSLRQSVPRFGYSRIEHDERHPAVFAVGDYMVVVSSAYPGDFSLRLNARIPQPIRVSGSVTHGGRLLIKWDVPDGMPADTTYTVTAQGLRASPNDVLGLGGQYTSEASASPALLSLPANTYSVYVRTDGGNGDGVFAREWPSGARALFSVPAAPSQFKPGDIVTDGNRYGAVAHLDTEGGVWHYTFSDQFGATSRLPESLLAASDIPQPSFSTGDYVTDGTNHGFITGLEWHETDQTWYYEFADQNGTVQRVAGDSLSLYQAPSFNLGDHVTTATVHGLVTSLEWNAVELTWYYSFTDQNGTSQKLAEGDLTLVPAARFSIGDHLTDGTDHGYVTAVEWDPANASWYYTFTDQNDTGRRLAEASLSFHLLTTPDNVQAIQDGTTGRYQISWEEPTGFDPATDTYEVQFLLDTATDWSSSVSTTATTAAISGVPQGKTWQARVRVKRVDGDETDYSDYASVSFTRPVYTVTSGGNAPTNLAAADDDSDGTYDVSWDEPGGFDPATDFYEFDIKFAAGETWSTFEWSFTSFSNTPEPGATVSVRVRAKYVEGTTISYSPYAETEFTRPASTATVYHAPGDLAASDPDGDGAYNVSWTEPSGFDPATDSYEIQVTDSSGSWSGSVPWSWTDFNTTPEEGETRRARVRAKYVDGTDINYSSWAQISFTRPAAPGSSGNGGSNGGTTPTPTYNAPTGLGASDDDSDGTYDVSWTEPSGFDPATDEYEAALKGTDGTWLPSFTWQWTDFTTALEEGETREVRVRAKYVDGNSVNYSSWVSTSVTRSTPPPTHNAPTGFSVVASSTAGRLNCSWSAPSGFDSATDKYDLGYRRSGTSTWSTILGSVIGSATSYNLTGLVHGAAYELRVRANYYTADGTLEGHSSWVSTTATTNSPPPPTPPPTPTYNAPTGLGASDDDSDGTYDVSWNQPSGFDSATDEYEVALKGTDGTWLPSFTWQWTYFTTALEEGETREVRVRAKYVDGGSTNYSSWRSVSFTRP